MKKNEQLVAFLESVCDELKKEGHTYGAIAKRCGMSSTALYRARTGGSIRATINCLNQLGYNVLEYADVDKKITYADQFFGDEE